MANIDKMEAMEELDANSQIESQFATQSLIQDLRQIIEQARGHVAATANYEQTMMYWHIGERINRAVLGNKRAEYGMHIVSQVATQLQHEYGKKGFEPRNIRRMMQFARLSRSSLGTIHFGTGQRFLFYRAPKANDYQQRRLQA